MSNLTKVWSSGSDTYKLVGLLGTPLGLFTTACNVYKSGNKSKIWVNHRNIYTGSQETIGQPFVYANAVYLPVEHGSHVLKYQNGGISHASSVKGRWSVAGCQWQHYPVVAYNDDYRNRKFYDNPKICRADTGQHLLSLNCKAMPRGMVDRDGVLWAVCNFGDNVLINSRGEKWDSDCASIALSNGQLYGGGGARWGPGGSANGGVYWRI